MATSTEKEEAKNKALWIVGGAAATALVYWYVNKTLREREELNLHRLEEKMNREKRLAEAGA